MEGQPEVMAHSSVSILHLQLLYNLLVRYDVVIKCLQTEQAAQLSHINTVSQHLSVALPVDHMVSVVLGEGDGGVVKGEDVQVRTGVEVLQTLSLHQDIAIQVEHL